MKSHAASVTKTSRISTESGRNFIGKPKWRAAESAPEEIDSQVMPIPFPDNADDISSSDEIDPVTLTPFKRNRISISHGTAASLNADKVQWMKEFTSYRSSQDSADRNRANAYYGSVSSSQGNLATLIDCMS